MWVTGPTYVQALPPLVVLQVLVLGPIALLCVYGIASQIGGRLLGYWAAFLWVARAVRGDPALRRPLPGALGRALPPAGARTDRDGRLPLDGARARRRRSSSSARSTPDRLTDAVVRRLLLGAAGGLKPPNLLMAFGAVLAYLVARRWREGLVFGAARRARRCSCSSLWKYRGLGELPCSALEQVRLAAGPRRSRRGRPRPLLRARLRPLAPADGLPARVLLERPARAVGAVRRAASRSLRVRRGAIAALLGGWLAAFLVVKGFSPRADIQANTFWRLLMPAWPAYLLLFASIPLLVPTLARRLGERRAAAADVGRSPPRWLVVAAVLTVVVPAAAIAASSPIERPGAGGDAGRRGQLHPHVRRRRDRARGRAPAPGGQRLTLDGRTGVARERLLPRLPPRGRGATRLRPHRGLAACVLLRARHADRDDARARRSSTPPPPPGATYRIGVGTNWVDDPEQGDVFAFSPPVTAAPRRARRAPRAARSAGRARRSRR